MKKNKGNRAINNPEYHDHNDGMGNDAVEIIDGGSCDRVGADALAERIATLDGLNADNSESVQQANAREVELSLNRMNALKGAIETAEEAGEDASHLRAQYAFFKARAGDAGDEHKEECGEENRAVMKK